MNGSRRAFNRYVLASGVLSTLGGTTLTALGQAKEKVRIGLPTRVYWPAIPVHVAQNLKLYEKEGLDAEITIYNSGGAAMEALAAGASDIISAGPASVAAARARGVKAKIVAAGMQEPAGFYILVKEGSPIRTPQDLEGKKLGITAPNSTTDFLALWVMEKSKTKMTKVAVGGGALVPNLLNGQLDAIVAYPPLGYSLLVSKEARVLMDLGKEMEPSLPDTWVAAEDAIAKRPQVIEATLRAIFGGLQYLQKNREYGVKFVQTYAQLPPAVAAMEYEKTLLPLPADGKLKEEWVETSMRLARLAGATTLPPVREMYTERFTPLKRVTTP